MPGALLDPPSPPSPFLPSSWLRTFRAHTFVTRIVRIPHSLVTSILSGTAYSNPSATVATEIEWSDGTVDTLPASSGSSDTYGIESAIEAAITELGGAVCPKFDTVTAVDATWANFSRSLKCTCTDDVLTLLKTSERVMQNVGERDVEVSLRKWMDLDERMEFRVFIKEEGVVGVCQRSAEIVVQYTQEEMDEIVERIQTFYENTVRGRWERVVMDAYLQTERVWIVDFGEWGRENALLFEWEELERAEWMSERAQFRCAVRQGGIRVSQRVFDGVPVELRGAQGGESLVEAARRLMEAENE